MTALAKAHSSPKILIADDDTAIVRFLTNRCEAMGFQVESASNGIQLLMKARKSQPDLLIVDVNMPELDGVSAAARFLNPGNKSMDVIVVTGSTDLTTQESCQSLGLFYCRKGADFWKNVESALLTIFPKTPRASSTGTRPGKAEDNVPLRPRVLIVDDDPAIFSFLASRLGKYGIDAIYASNAVEAVRIASREQPSVIISDYNMPDGDAQYLLSRLRNNTATEKVPFFVLSGMEIDEQTEHNLRREIFGRAGAKQVFKKSFDVRELFAALEKVCAFDKTRDGK